MSCKNNKDTGGGEMITTKLKHLLMVLNADIFNLPISHVQMIKQEANGKIWFQFLRGNLGRTNVP